MPITTTYPGVYIEELASGARVITGVATSITAFLGRAPRGPVNRPIKIYSFADYEREFGGLNAASTMSFAVADFFANGGSQAVIVRLFTPSEEDFSADLSQATDAVGKITARLADTALTDVTAAKAAAREVAAAIKASGAFEEVATKAADKVAETANAPANDTVDKVRTAATTERNAQIDAVKANEPNIRARIPLATANASEKLGLRASSPGTWAKDLLARVDHKTVKRLRTEDQNLLFNLTVRDPVGKVTERFLNVSVQADHPRRVDRVLAAESSLVEVAGPLPPGRPNAHQDLPANQDPFEPNHATWYSAVENQNLVDSASLAAKDYTGSQLRRTGLFALDGTDLVNLLCLPPDSRDGNLPSEVHTAALNYCRSRRAFYIVNGPTDWDNDRNSLTRLLSSNAPGALAALGLTGEAAANAAVFFPRLREADPLREGRLDLFPPSGAVAGVFARTDATRGVWKAPAGIDATLTGARDLAVNLTDAENGTLNPLGINTLRSFPVTGPVVWGSRTARGADQLADIDNRYIPVRRLTLFLEESLYRSTQFAVFEPNDEPLWATLRQAIGAFMLDLFRQGAFAGRTPNEAFRVRCDNTTTTKEDIERGRVIVLVQFAPLRPAEFVILRIQQLAGQTQT